MGVGSSYRTVAATAANRGVLVFLISASAAVAAAADLAPIPRRIPPQGIELPGSARAELRAAAEELGGQIQAVSNRPHIADVQIFHKAVEYALDHGEFYHPKDLAKARWALDEAGRRLRHLADAPWTRAQGLVVRGYHASIDQSPQPYGLVIPRGFKPPPGGAPLYVWLHGRGDKVTDLHFIHQRAHAPGRLEPADALVLHPFGRHCMGFKHAGEVDVLESIEHVLGSYRVDRDRIVLMGFSMGGAGAWHIGAHHADRFAAVHAGAGFAETARYNRLAPADYPPWYEQKLWGLYDVPGYVRNLFNVPVLAYSGERDKQIQAARVMAEAFARHGRKLPHLIGPGMGHKYDAESWKTIRAEMAKRAGEGADRHPASVHLQTRTLRYNRMHWLSLDGLKEHWKEARADARVLRSRDRGRIDVQVRNVTAFTLRHPAGGNDLSGSQVVINGQSLIIPSPRPIVPAVSFIMEEGRWRETVLLPPRRDGLHKRPGLQGPIDDAFLEPFLVVRPTGRARSPQVQAWVEFELRHLIDRWRALFRAELPVCDDTAVTADQIERDHLVLFGDPQSNRLIARVNDKLPLRWTDDSVGPRGRQAFDRARHVPILIYPNPLQPKRYVVLNSGPTFREGHDRTNSLQNPKLPDWAILEISKPPTDTAAGRVVAADFFDERWRLRAPRDR